ncbi:MAG TPA: VOC family protein [Vicinamibacterales bacterium]|nr:VOC family protein [Vicinamibacterales bacterium]
MNSWRAFSRIVATAIVFAAASALVPVPQAAPARAANNVANGRFVWHDLVTADVMKSRAFYGQLFGWTFEAGAGIDPGYTIIKHQGQQIGGIVPREGTNVTAQWLSYVVVADVDATAKSFERGGGRLFRGPLNARKDLRVAVVADAQGASVGLVSRGPNVRDDGAVPAVNRWLWVEYVARDPDAALSFLGESLGFEHEVGETRDAFTYYLLKTDRPRVGLFRSPWPRDSSAWLPYVRVADPARTAAHVVELGGTVLVPPGPRVRNGSLAIVLDPEGAPIALQKYPFDAGATTP